MEKADVIIVVGGSVPDLAEIAADLWKKEYAPRVFIGGGVSIKTGKFPGPRSKQDIYCGDYATEYDFYKEVLLKNGVSESAIIGENRSSYTRQNAAFAREVFEGNQIKISKAILVCKSFHARRCLMFFQSELPGVEFLVKPYEVCQVTKSDWFETETGVKRVLGELTRCGDQFTLADINHFLDR